jgi:mono/diheme cytochrome c family protein
MSFAGGKMVALAEYQGPDPTGAPATLSSASVVARGEYLARAADCAACHTAKGGTPFAGGRSFVLPFGTLYSPNITADVDTGIGKYSDADFLKAVRRGIRIDGAGLYPAMPYPSYAGITDADALAIKAYLFSLAPVHTSVPENSLIFPVNQRWLMRIWSTLFNSDRRFQPNISQTPQWNRGAYLTEALEHCGECHTPRSLFQSLNHRRKFAGTVQAGWRAYNITADQDSGVGAWSDVDLANYLSTGHADGRGSAAGPMAEAVDLSLRHLTSADIDAMVAYLRTVPPIASSGLPTPKETPAPTSHREGVAANDNAQGKLIFEGACASCHGWTGESPLTPDATLVGTRAVNDPTATNVAQIILFGARKKAEEGSVFMPAFGNAYSDAEIAAVANYVTARFGSTPSELTKTDVARMRRTGP